MYVIKFIFYFFSDITDKKRLQKIVIKWRDCWLVIQVCILYCNLLKYSVTKKILILYCFVYLDCTFGELALIFEEPSISTLKITWWTSLAMRLDIPPDTWKKWLQDLRLDKLTHINVIHDILTEWRMTKSNQATLGALYKAIPNDIKQFKGIKINNTSY